MKIEYSAEFKKQYQKLPLEIQKSATKQLTIFLKNPRHPSLNTKKLKGQNNLWQGRISKSYRFVFFIENNLYKLISIFHHK
ncbi:MAG: hypothetical protein ABIG60_00180 [Patescibacteria group bacterium]